MSLIPLSTLTKFQPPMMEPLCGTCGLMNQCESPKMKVAGRGRRKILIVGEAPGKDEDRQGLPFVGASGQMLQRLLLKHGVMLREDCWITNAVICHPRNNFMKDDKPVDYCRPNLIKAVKELEPEVIIPLGKRAVKSVIGHLWKDNTKGIFRWAGFRIPCRKPNVWVCPSIHPSFVLHRRDKKGEYKDRGLAERYLESHIAAACALEGRPWKTVPDYMGQVTIKDTPEAAALVIRAMIKEGGPVSFDYETTCLKPEGPNSRILCASVCYGGKVTIVFPWIGEAVTAMKGLLLANNPKISHNMSFEDRWTRAKLGIEVKNWFWDTMVQAHTLDPRGGTKSLKFQAFVNLGQEDYDSHISQFLGSKDPSSYALNRIRDIERTELHRYCGLDSLLTYKLAELQTARLGVEM